MFPPPPPPPFAFAVTSAAVSAGSGAATFSFVQLTAVTHAATSKLTTLCVCIRYLLDCGAAGIQGRELSLHICIVSRITDWETVVRTAASTQRVVWLSRYIESATHSDASMHRFLSRPHVRFSCRR